MVSSNTVTQAKISLPVVLPDQNLRQVFRQIAQAIISLLGTVIFFAYCPQTLIGWLFLVSVVSVEF